MVIVVVLGLGLALVAGAVLLMSWSASAASSTAENASRGGMDAALSTWMWAAFAGVSAAGLGTAAGVSAANV